MRPQARLLEEVVAYFDLAGSQYRYPGIVAAAQFGIVIDIDIQQLKTQFWAQALQRLHHFAAQVTTPAGIDRQLPCQAGTATGMRNQSFAGTLMARKVGLPSRCTSRATD